MRFRRLSGSVRRFLYLGEPGDASDSASKVPSPTCNTLVKRMPSDPARRRQRLAQTRLSGYITGNNRRSSWAVRRNAPFRTIDLALVLQLYLLGSLSIVASFCDGLMAASPDRPRPTKAHVRWAFGLEMGDEPTQFLHADHHERRGFGHAAADRLLLFALSGAVLICASFKRARKLARKASASIDSLICRCPPCQD